VLGEEIEAIEQRERAEIRKAEERGDHEEVARAYVNETWPHCAGEYWPHLGVSECCSFCFSGA
jgi:hypothetical protein